MFNVGENLSVSRKNRFADGPRLLADVGGTNGRFALETAPGAIEPVRSYACNAFPSLVEAIQQYLNDANCDRVRHAAVAIANPNHVKMTNHHWEFSIEATRRSLGFTSLVVENDFTSLAMALPRMTGKHWRQIGEGTPRTNSPIGLLGPGTGLGVSGLLYSNGDWIPLASEGGHVTFSPVDDRDDLILRYARTRWSHVSFERIAAGPGLSVIYDALATRQGAQAPNLEPGTIVELASNADELARESISCFCGLLGTLAGNLALALSAKGGVFVGGGVARKLGALFDVPSFRQKFEQKGRFESMLRMIPTYQITAEHPTLLGVSALLSNWLDRRTFRSWSRPYDS
ncbi:glucokinase [Paraburkholderia bannensis]|uniref:glucokinase n=1 Tax=Paraburkholderia bannensis TaxID=765414 RepID=UPI002AC32C1D|nr:glucokinase [Paraburkholderia bannensis]